MSCTSLYHLLPTSGVPNGEIGWSGPLPQFSKKGTRDLSRNGVKFFKNDDAPQMFKGVVQEVFRDYGPDPATPQTPLCPRPLYHCCPSFVSATNIVDFIMYSTSFEFVIFHLQSRINSLLLCYIRSILLLVIYSGCNLNFLDVFGK